MKSFIQNLKPSRSLESYTPDERRAMWPPAPELTSKHIANCRLLENRDVMLDFMPKQEVCAEIGIFKGDFSKKIIAATQPTKLHLFDIDPEAIARVNKRFSGEIANQNIETHLGNSSEIMDTLPEEYFGWIYIDGDHTYEGVRKDLVAAHRTLKTGGMIALNDYIYFAPSDFKKYGVVEAVNEFCINNNFELRYFALQGRMYNDVVIREIR